MNLLIFFEISDETEIHELEDNESYRYLGVMEADDRKQSEMKARIKKKYIHRLIKVLKSKLTAGNLITTINTWAVSLYRYGAEIIQWVRAELQQLDKRMRKLMTMHKGRVYVERDQGERGLMSVVETVKYESHSLKKYTEHNSVEFIRTAGKIINTNSEDGKQDYRNHGKTERKQNWNDKPMNRQHLRQTEDQAAKETWPWVKRGCLKRETESLIIAAQDQALRTNYRKAKIEKSTTDPKCRLCKQNDETVSHTVSECSKIAYTEYKGRHDKVASAVHWSICKKDELPHTEQWYDYRAEAVLEKEKVKLLWDFNVQTDKANEARSPDLILINK
ncbi:uncharacterized protein [Watersipora subatra]|uniref:uncharacterized protein n=1 Tax=Watersipora subatra TaxID=2589382 RepID=UPI00355C54C6